MQKPTLLTDHNFGVIVLCPDCNYAGLRLTVNSLKSDFPGIPYIAVVEKNAHVENIKTLEKYCHVYKAGETITSLIDCGMSKMNSLWRLIVVSGTPIRYSILKKFKLFITDEKDIVFPVINRKYLWDESSINGIFLHKNACEIGEFGDEAVDISEAKLLWAGKAIDKGYKFKGIVGGRLI
jgi:hypothetical protein